MCFGSCVAWWIRSRSMVLKRPQRAVAQHHPMMKVENWSVISWCSRLCFPSLLSLTSFEWQGFYIFIAKAGLLKLFVWFFSVNLKSHWGFTVVIINVMWERSTLPYYVAGPCRFRAIGLLSFYSLSVKLFLTPTDLPPLSGLSYCCW